MSGSSAARKGRRLVPVEPVSAVLLAEGGTPAHGVLSNVSEHGACLVTDLPVEPDRRVRLGLRDAAGRPLLDVDGRVVWCREGIDPVKEIVGILLGVSFADVAEEERSRIAAVLDSSRFHEVVPPDTPEQRKVLLAEDA